VDGIHGVVAADEEQVADVVALELLEDARQLLVAEFVSVEPSAEDGVARTRSSVARLWAPRSTRRSCMNPSMPKRIP
jgi:hypothetical protein